MTQSMAPNKSEENLWRVDVLRLSAFIVPDQLVDTSNWWNIVVHEPPEVRNSQPKLKMQHEEGPFEGGRLILNTLPGRADWLFIPAFDPQMGGPDVDLSPAYGVALSRFMAVAEPWLKESPPLWRLAFGAVLKIPAQNMSDGYRGLTRYLPAVTIDPDNSTDFLYQINRPRMSGKVTGLTLNRLSKWAVATAIFGLVPIGLPLRDGVADQRFWAQLELDINTSPEYKGPIAPTQSMDVFSELVTLAEELAIGGDVP